MLAEWAIVLFYWFTAMMLLHTVVS